MRRAFLWALAALLPLSGCLHELEDPATGQRLLDTADPCRSLPANKGTPAETLDLAEESPVYLPQDRVVRLLFAHTGWALRAVDACASDHYYLELTDADGAPKQIGRGQYAFVYLFDVQEGPALGFGIELWDGEARKLSGRAQPVPLDVYASYHLVVATNVEGLALRLAPASSLGESAARSWLVALGAPPLPTMELKPTLKTANEFPPQPTRSEREFTLESSNPIPAILYVNAQWGTRSPDLEAGQHSYELEYDISYVGTNGTTRDQDRRTGGSWTPALTREDRLDLWLEHVSEGPWKITTKLRTDDFLGSPRDAQLRALAIPYVADIDT